MDSYDTWKTGYNELGDADFDDYKENEMDRAKDWLEGIVEQLYSKDALDPLEFERCLDELCHIIGAKMNPNDLQIQRKVVGKVQPLQPWIEYNNNYLKSIERL